MHVVDNNQRLQIKDLPTPSRFYPGELENCIKLRSDLKMLIEKNDFKNAQDRADCVRAYRTMNTILNKYFATYPDDAMRITS